MEVAKKITEQELFNIATTSKECELQLSMLDTVDSRGMTNRTKFLTNIFKHELKKEKYVRIAIVSNYSSKWWWYTQYKNEGWSKNWITDIYVNLCTYINDTKKYFSKRTKYNLVLGDDVFFPKIKADRVISAFNLNHLRNENSKCIINGYHPFVSDSDGTFFCPQKFCLQDKIYEPPKQEDRIRGSRFRFLDI